MSDPLDWWYRRRKDPFRRLFSDEFFEEFDRLFEDMFRNMEKNFPKELIREKRLPDGSIAREAGPFIYGYSVTIGPGGKPEIKEFGNIKPTEKGKTPFEITNRREPLVDVLDEVDRIRVVAEIPGVEKEQIQLEIVDNVLQITVEGKRKYYKEVELSTRVDAESVRATYKNGVLEVTLNKIQTTKKSGKTVKID